MADLTDADLIGFLRASGVTEEEMEATSAHGEQEALLAAFRADCQLYEDYKRPAQLPPLRSKLMVLLGKDDKVTCTADTYGWLDEVDAEESRVVRVAGATHHVHEEQPDAVADHLMHLIGIAPPKQVVLTVERALELPSGVASPPRKKTASPPGSPRNGAAGAAAAKEVTVTLPPPEDFVRGVDTEALQSFREGNLLYRMGSHNGSKGELSSLTTLSRNRSEEWPSRTASPMEAAAEERRRRRRRRRRRGGARGGGDGAAPETRRARAVAPGFRWRLVGARVRAEGGERGGRGGVGLLAVVCVAALPSAVLLRGTGVTYFGRRFGGCTHGTDDDGDGREG